MKDLEAIMPSYESADKKQKVPHSAKMQENAPITAWVLDLGEAESA